MVEALKAGWSFGKLEYTTSKRSRHSLWASRPGDDGWQCHKIDGSVEPGDGAVMALMDEAGVP